MVRLGSDGDRARPFGFAPSLSAAQLVGEDYHKLFLTDFAPYLTKIKASGAEAVYTGLATDTGGFRFSNTRARALGVRIGQGQPAHQTGECHRSPGFMVRSILQQARQRPCRRRRQGTQTRSSGGDCPCRRRWWC